MAETVRTLWRDQAYQAAEAILTKHTTMRGLDATRVARLMVQAAAPKIRGEYAQKLGGISDTEVYSMLAATTVTLAVDLATFVAVFRRGGRGGKLIAVTGALLHTGLAVYGARKRHQIRAAAVAATSKATPE